MWVCAGWMLVGWNNPQGSHKFPQQWTSEILNPLDYNQCNIISFLYETTTSSTWSSRSSSTCMVDCIKAGCTVRLPSLCCTHKMKSWACATMMWGLSGPRMMMSRRKRRRCTRKMKRRVCAWCATMMWGCEDDIDVDEKESDKDYVDTCSCHGLLQNSRIPPSSSGTGKKIIKITVFYDHTLSIMIFLINKFVRKYS